jgi:hypothetical protein
MDRLEAMTILLAAVDYAGASTMLRLGGAPSRLFGSTIPPTAITIAIDQNAPRMMIFF